jgi:HK97 family phage major capsid protein
MLESTKIQRRQSEIRQTLSALVGKSDATEDETRQMESLDGEYRQNEIRFRAALVAEDTERREAGSELETREGRQWNELVAGFELRQAVFHLDEGRALSGRTAEVVEEMRSAGGYRGVPIPLAAMLETRAGETIANGTPDPMQTMPIVDRLFSQTVAGRMGVATVNIGQGEREYPVVSSAIAAGWADGELANVAGPTAFATTDKALAPDSNFGVQLRMTRKALKQSGAGLEAAMRRDMLNAMQVGLDRAVFLGTGADGQPLGIIPGAATYGITSTDASAAATYALFRAAAIRFMLANAAASPADVRLLMRPEIWGALDGTIFDAGSGITEWDRLSRAMPNTVTTSNALAAPAGGPPLESTAVMTTTAGGLPPAFMAIWGGVDLIRDVYTDAQSGGLRLTGIVTADVTVPRGSQVEIITGVQ